MLNEREVYVAFRVAQGKYFDRPFRLPKVWDVFFNKMEKKNKECLELITKFFNTKWQNIDPEVYFRTGFEVYRSGFTYTKFFDKILLKHYITKDKVEKINTTSIFDDFEKSAKYVDSIIEGGKTSKIIRYANRLDGVQPVAVSDYIKNRIGKFFLIYLVEKGFITLTHNQMLQIPYVTTDYNDNITRLKRAQETKEFKKIIKTII